MGEWVPVDEYLDRAGETAKTAPVRPEEHTVARQSGDGHAGRPRRDPDHPAYRETVAQQQGRGQRRSRRT